MRYHNWLAELVAAKKGEDYATTVSWIRSKVSFAILRSALLCLRGSTTAKRTIRSNVQEADFELEKRLTKNLGPITFIIYPDLFKAFHIGIATMSAKSVDKFCPFGVLKAHFPPQLYDTTPSPQNNVGFPVSRTCLFPVQH